MSSAVPRRAAPTINDLRVKECFICQEVEHHDDPGHSPEDWVHPCKCTLIAHQSCLMDLIRHSLKTRPRSPVQCPQCGFKYKLVQRRMFFTVTNLFFRVGERVINLASSGFMLSCGLVMGGGFIYFGATALGEQATRLMFGDELFDLLLTDEPANWPGLPRFFVPLVAARFMTRTFSNIISLAGMYIMWPKVPPPAVQEKLLANSNRIDRIVPDYRPRTSTSWPPRIAQFGGIVAATSIVYSLLFNKFRRWVLDLPRQVERPTRRRRRRGHRIAGNLNLNLGRDGNRRRQAQAGAPAPEPDVDDDDDDEDPRIVRLEGITRSRYSKLFSGLFTPFIANGIGHLLYLWSMHLTPLRSLLGIRPPGISAGPPPKLIPEFTNSVHRAWYWQWFTDETIDQMDPVWIRNTVGLGIYVVGRDCLHLFHLWLAKRELASRRLKNRDFAGIDPAQLDLLPRS